MAHAKELALIAVIVALVYASAAASHPRPSSQALQGEVGLCLHYDDPLNVLMRDMESLPAALKTPWDGESVPDHNTTGNHLNTIDEDWPQSMPTRAARVCMETTGWTSGSTASDSSGAGLNMYETAKKDGRRERKKYAKFHVAPILGLQIVLDSRITPSDTHDTRVPDPMPETTKEQGLDVGPSTHSCDTAYDFEENFRLLFSHNLTPNSGRGLPPPGKNPEKSKADLPNRAKGAELFDPAEYAKRDMIEVIFGVWETKNHQLHCRFIKGGNMRRFGKIRGIRRRSTAFAAPENSAYPYRSDLKSNVYMVSFNNTRQPAAHHQIRPSTGHCSAGPAHIRAV